MQMEEKNNIVYFLYHRRWMSVVSPRSRFVYIEVVSPTRPKWFRLRDLSRFAYIKVVSFRFGEINDTARKAKYSGPISLEYGSAQTSYTALRYTRFASNVQSHLKFSGGSEPHLHNFFKLCQKLPLIMLIKC